MAISSERGFRYVLNCRADITGEPFTLSSVEEAKQEYKRLLEGLKNVGNKSEKMQAVSMEAWAQLKKDRGIKSDLGRRPSKGSKH